MFRTHHPARRRWRTRLATYLATAGLASTLGVLVAPVAAHAGAKVPCPADIQYWHVIGVVPHGGLIMYEGLRYRVTSSTPRFLASDGRAVTNNLDYPVSATVTASRTETFQITTTVGVANELTEQLTLNVSTAITQIRSTTVGVATTFDVPAHSTVYADYGVHGYDVAYYVEKWHKRNGTNQLCEEWGYYPSTTIAPTYVEGWQLRVG